MTPTILITRPAPTDAEFADQIRARLGDVHICLSPLMRIAFSDDLPDLEDIRTLVFTSRNGVQSFIRISDHRDFACYCVGDATAQAAQAEGFSTIAGDGSSSDLVARLVADKPNGSCLHVRGTHSVGDIAGELTSTGVPAHEAILYDQVSQPLSSEAQALLCGETPVILPLFSPRTARLLSENAHNGAQMHVAALSQNVADALPSDFAATVLVARRPDTQAMLDVVQALVDPGKALERGNLAQ